jgi:hypothetical protein
MDRVENQVLFEHGSSSPHQNLERTSRRRIVTIAMLGEPLGSLRAKQTLFRARTSVVGNG